MSFDIYDIYCDAKYEFAHGTAYVDRNDGIIHIENVDNVFLGNIGSYSTNEMSQMERQLKNGADPLAEGWEDGVGHTLAIDTPWDKDAIQDIYADAYIDEMECQVDGYDGDQDAETGTPWQTYHLNELREGLTIDQIRAQAIKDAQEDAEEVQKALDDEARYI